MSDCGKEEGGREGAGEGVREAGPGRGEGRHGAVGQWGTEGGGQ